MTQTFRRTRQLRLALAALVAGTALYTAPIAVRSAYATEDPSASKCNVTCSRGTCSAEGANCTCTCSMVLDIATCSCTEGSGSGGGSGGSGEKAT